LSGDLEIGQKFQAAVGKIDIDWEEHLSQYTGDIVAHKIGNLVRDVFDWGGKALDNFNLDVAEYVHYEALVLPDRNEIETYVNNVDSIRSDIDRIAARVTRLHSDWLAEQKTTKNQKA